MAYRYGFTLIALLFIIFIVLTVVGFALFQVSKRIMTQSDSMVGNTLNNNHNQDSDEDFSLKPLNYEQSNLFVTDKSEKIFVDSFDYSSKYPVHKGITATVFWVGEPVGNGSSEDNSISAWDDEWLKNYGGYDDPVNRNGYYPASFKPLQNPFYLDLPYNDFDWGGKRKKNAYKVVPWANEKVWGDRESMMKNRWVKLSRNGIFCYGQIQDAGPYEYDDYEYVFGGKPPKNTLANKAGMDVSPALRDCLRFEGINNAENKVDWQFVDEKDVPDGPWKEIVTTTQINWK